MCVIIKILIIGETMKKILIICVICAAVVTGTFFITRNKGNVNPNNNNNEIGEKFDVIKAIEYNSNLKNIKLNMHIKFTDESQTEKDVPYYIKDNFIKGINKEIFLFDKTCELVVTAFSL